ncbi:MAG TPA: hypothetical protein V6D47_17195 [Oscillatoriaceae cyanobacterium]
MRRLLVLVMLLLLSRTAHAAPDSAIWGTMPAYPGATRPLAKLENARLAIAVTTDKPKAVLGYYLSRLATLGWSPARFNTSEAQAAHTAGQPAWITFLHPGLPAVTVEVAQGRHPRTGAMLTLIYYQRAPYKP